MAALYPQYYDPFDPEEQRRRQLLAPDASDDEEGEPAPDDEQEEVTPSQTASATSSVKLSPGQQRYMDVLNSAPKSEDYKPSKGRRILAAIAGGFAGAADPHLGVQTAQNLISQPYQRATSNWQRSIMAAQGGTQMEKEASAQDVARRRAEAYEQNATARQKAADATEKFRQFQMDRMPWTPHTRDEAEAMEKLKHPVTPKAWAPTSMEDYLRVHPPVPHADPMLLESTKHKNRLAEQAAHDNRVNALRRELALNHKTGTPATPQQQSQAEHLAAQQLIRTNPEYASFYDPGDATKRIPPRIKTIADLPKSGGMFSGVTPTQESLARDKYRQFLSELDKTKKGILGPKATGGSQWDIQQEDEEDQ